MESLREEILQAQKVRSDLLKWKLLIVAVIGAVGLGISKTTFPHSHTVLLLIPLVCLYIDLLCRHLSLRTKAIGEFMRRNEAPGKEGQYLTQYERFYKENPKQFFEFETWALHWSTIIISVLAPASYWILATHLEKLTCKELLLVSALALLVALSCIVSTVVLMAKFKSIVTNLETWTSDKKGP